MSSTQTAAGIRAKRARRRGDPNAPPLKPGAIKPNGHIGMPGKLDDPQLCADILHDIRSGMPWTKAVESRGVHRYSWLMRLKIDPPLDSAYREALEQSAEVCVSDVRKIAETSTFQTWHEDKVKLLALQWLSSRLNRSRYGDKSEVEVRGMAAVQPIINITVSSAPEQPAIEVLEQKTLPQS